MQTSLLCNILGKILKLLTKNIQKNVLFIFEKCIPFLIISQALICHASTLDEIISPMDYKGHKLEDAPSPLSPTGKKQSTSLFLSDSHPEATPSAYTPLFFSYPYP